MTLAEVAAKVRTTIHYGGTELGKELDGLTEEIVAAFEADPEFKLPEHIEALATYYDDLTDMDGTPYARLFPGEVARRIRQVLEGK